MNYEIAKKLKEKGFPQKEPLTNVSSVFIPAGKLLTGDEFAYIPTLSELIEACGGYFCSLNNKCGSGS